MHDRFSNCLLKKSDTVFICFNNNRSNQRCQNLFGDQSNSFRHESLENRRSCEQLVTAFMRNDCLKGEIVRVGVPLKRACVHY